MDRLIDMPELGASFELPEKISVKQSLQFWAGWRQADEMGDMVVVERWKLVNRLGLLTNWKCEYFADPKQSLDDAEDARIADVIIRAVAAILTYMIGLRNVEKKA